MDGTCDRRYAAVADVFEANFAAGLEVGAACAIVLDGRFVVDLWGGSTAPAGAAWHHDTLVEIRSATKGVTALCAHMLVDRGLVDLDAPVRRYWPELRADPLVRHALTHEAGIPVIDAPLGPNALIDWDAIASAVAVQEPLWDPGERHGYHGVTFGWLIGELVRRVDGRSIGRFVRDEVAAPLDPDFFIGTPSSEHHRIAPMVAPPVGHGAPSTRPILAVEPDSLAARMYAPVFPPVSPPWNSPEFWSAEIPVTNGICTARALAAIYGDLASDRPTLVRADTVERMGVQQVAGTDAVLGIDVRRTLGFELAAPWADDGRPPHAFGHPGAGGFLGFADPEARVGFAYVKNAGWGGEPGRDPRAASLVKALYASLA
ncbi:MAG TPA: serine hydrolase domain-containing protein [Acidimicrobiia bacterium]